MMEITTDVLPGNCQDVPPRRKVFFFHIPKTAGSSFNSFLRSHIGPGAEHAEQFLPPGEPLALLEFDHLVSLNYISGHLPFPVFEVNGFPRSEYFQTTLLREPIAQLVSQFNWLVRIREQEGFEGYPTEIRQMSDEIAAADLNRPWEFIAMLQRYRGMLQNTQTRMFANVDGVASVANAIANLRSLDLVGLSERYDDFLSRFATLCQLPPVTAEHIAKENVNTRPRVTTQWIHETPQVLDFVVEYNALDLFLYDFVQQSMAGNGHNSSWENVAQSDQSRPVTIISAKPLVASRPKVFGIGLNMTGTSILRQCLTYLGYRHMGARRDLLEQFRKGDLRPALAVSAAYDSFEDWPWPLMYRELFVRYGAAARYILTTRATPDAWLESLKENSLRTSPTQHCRMLAYGYDYPQGYEREHLEIYERHNREVKQFFREQNQEHLLLEVCWERGDGWEQLCRFLDLPIPNAEFPSN